MHGVRVDLLEKQAASLNLPLHKLMVPEMPTMETYNQQMAQMLNGFHTQGVRYSIFGDILSSFPSRLLEKQRA